MKLAVELFARSDLVKQFPRTPENVSSSFEGYLQERADKGLTLVAFSEVGPSFRCVFSKTEPAQTKSKS